MDYSELTRQAAEAVDHLLASAEYRKGDIFIIGCSTSEIVGKRIGSASSEEAAKAVMDAILPKVTEAGLYLAVQGCEHINRAIRADAGLDIGGTLIGMHLHPVVVPVQTEQRKIGEASFILAKTRPKYVGGPRAQYGDDAPAHR